MENLQRKINSRGYIIYKKHYSLRSLQRYRKDLKVKPFVNKKVTFSVPNIYPVFLENNDKLCVPVYYGLEKFGEPDKNFLKDGDKINLEFNGELRDLQKPVVKSFLDQLKEKRNVYGGIISIGCGQGKTVLSLYLISKIKRKTIIIVHKEFLLFQWRDRIKQFLPEAKIGIVQGKKVDIQNKDIVLVMLQSLAMKDYPLNLFKEFGFCITDECHHISSEVFSKALPKVCMKYMLGLSATPKRKDGLSKVFHWFLGPTIYQGKRDKKNVKIKVLEYNNDDENYSREELLGNDKLCSSRMINNVAYYDRRTSFIVKIIIDMYKDDNRCMLILSDRRKHLQSMYDKLVEIDKDISIGFYVGGMNQKRLDKSSKKRIILSTFSMSQEGLDIPTLNTVFFTTPKSDIVQSLGRILRKVHKDVLPTVWDIKDNFSLFAKQYLKRQRYYNKMDYEIYMYFVYDKGEDIDTLYKNSKNNCVHIEKKKRGRKKKDKIETTYAFIEG